MSLFGFLKSGRIKKSPWLQKKIRKYFYDLYVKDLQLNLELEAMHESVAYIKKNMREAMIFSSWHALHSYAIEHAELNGLFLEFGTKRGHSIREIAKMTTHTIHGFDSKGGLIRLPGNVVVHKGWFDETLPEFTKDHGDVVAYMHIDCDLYSSTRTIFEQLANRIVTGTVIVFDEYFNYPNWQQHEYRAFREFVNEHGIEYRYLGLLSYDGVVAVKITGKHH
jgi:hypothetical protein